MADKIDSNITGLAIAEESAVIGVLPGSPVWYDLEPNGYSDFGGQIATVARDPINPSRQRKKGVTTDLDASGGYSSDLTFSNMTRLLQGFFFADIREKPTSNPMNGTLEVTTGVTAADDTYTLAAAPVLLAGHLIFAQGFTALANNGLQRVASRTATTVVVQDGLVNETPPAAAYFEAVGYQFETGSVDLAMNGDLVNLDRISGTVNWTTLGLIPGEWIFLGGDSAPTFFTTNDPGLARIRSVAATQIVLDKVSWAPVAEVGAAKTIQIFFGSVIKNENVPANIVRRTYQLERTLGSDGNGVMSEYLVGSVANELKINVAQADKITLDLTFMSIDNEQRTGLTGVKTGSHVSAPIENAYNTSSDFFRIQLASAGDDASPTPMFAFATEMSLSISNNASPNKAIGTLGAFDVTVGNFEVDGDMTAYFADIAGVQAVRNNADISIDFAIIKENRGMLFDLPLLSLGNARLNVEKDAAIMLPLEMMGAESIFNHTLLFNSFTYLPNAAA